MIWSKCYLYHIALVCFTAVNQEYSTSVPEEYVVTGNFALMKCSIPSFVADLITVVSWIDSNGITYTPNPLNLGI